MRCPTLCVYALTIVKKGSEKVIMAFCTVLFIFSCVSLFLGSLLGGECLQLTVHTLIVLKYLCDKVVECFCGVCFKCCLHACVL